MQVNTVVTKDKVKNEAETRKHRPGFKARIPNTATGSGEKGNLFSQSLVQQPVIFNK